MPNPMRDKLLEHEGHKIEIAVYGDKAATFGADDVTVGCIECDAVLISSEDHEIDLEELPTHQRECCKA